MRDRLYRARSFYRRLEMILVQSRLLYVACQLFKELRPGVGAFVEAYMRTKAAA